MKRRERRAPPAFLERKCACTFAPIASLRRRNDVVGGTLRPPRPSPQRRGSTLRPIPEFNDGALRIRLPNVSPSPEPERCSCEARERGVYAASPCDCSGGVGLFRCTVGYCPVKRRKGVKFAWLLPRRKVQQRVREERMYVLPCSWNWMYQNWLFPRFTMLITPPVRFWIGDRPANPDLGQQPFPNPA